MEFPLRGKELLVSMDAYVVWMSAIAYDGSATRVPVGAFEKPLDAKVHAAALETKLGVHHSVRQTPWMGFGRYECHMFAGPVPEFVVDLDEHGAVLATSEQWSWGGLRTGENCEPTAFAGASVSPLLFQGRSVNSYAEAESEARKALATYQQSQPAAGQNAHNHNLTSSSCGQAPASTGQNPQGGTVILKTTALGPTTQNLPVIGHMVDVLDYGAKGDEPIRLVPTDLRVPDSFRVSSFLHAEMHLKDGSTETDEEPYTTEAGVNHRVRQILFARPDVVSCVAVTVWKREG